MRVGNDGDEEGHPSAIHQPGEHVPPQDVGAQEIGRTAGRQRLADRAEPIEILVVRVVRRQHWGEKGGGEKDGDDARAEQRRRAEGA